MVFRLAPQNIMRLHDWVQSIKGYFHRVVTESVVFKINGKALAGIFKRRRSVAINKANFENEILLTEILLLMAVRRTPVPARFLVKQQQWVVSLFGSIALVSLLLVNAVQLNAIPVLTQTILFNNSIGAVSGSFDGGGNTLAALADLTDASAAPREYVSQFFKPVMSGTYVFGLSSSNEDTVLILYEGEFDPKSPQSRATLINDDSNGVGPGGVVITSCGGNKTLCPKISTSLTGGQIYTIVVTSYLPSVTISDGVGFYIYGEPVLIGTQTQENVGSNLSKTIRVQTRQILSNFLNTDDEYAASECAGISSQKSRLWRCARVIKPHIRTPKSH